MKALVTLVALLAVVALAQPVQAAGVFAEIAKNAGQRQNFRQTKALNNQAVRLGLVAPVYAPNLAFVAPAYSYHAQAQLRAQVRYVPAAPLRVYAPAQRIVAYAPPQQIVERVTYVQPPQQIVERVVEQYSAPVCGQQLNLGYTQGYSQQLNNGGCGQFFTQPYSR